MPEMGLSGTFDQSSVLYKLPSPPLLSLWGKMLFIYSDGSGQMACLQKDVWRGQDDMGDVSIRISIF